MKYNQPNLDKLEKSTRRRRFILSGMKEALFQSGYCILEQKKSCGIEQVFYNWRAESIPCFDLIPPTAGILRCTHGWITKRCMRVVMRPLHWRKTNWSHISPHCLRFWWLSYPPINITFFGFPETSSGVPMIGCECEVCQSANKKDKRLRSSIIVRSANTTIVVDTGPDFRYQMLRDQSETPSMPFCLLTPTRITSPDLDDVSRI